MSNIIKFISKIPKPDKNGCWTWKYGITKNGYARFSINGKSDYVHRISYRIHKGEIPQNLQIDHLCRNRKCINPGHLDLVTSKENTLRGTSMSAINARKTHCKNGHPFFGENLIIKKYGKNSPRRFCKICLRIFWKNNYYKRIDYYRKRYAH